MRTVVLPFLVLGALSASAQGPPAQRFEGSASLRLAPQSSGDGRFALSAKLHAAAPIPSNGRFRVDARLDPGGNAKALATACGPVTPNIFTNGFEN